MASCTATATAASEAGSTSISGEDFSFFVSSESESSELESDESESEPDPDEEEESESEESLSAVTAALLDETFVLDFFLDLRTINEIVSASLTAQKQNVGVGSQGGIPRRPLGEAAVVAMPTQKQ